MTSQIIKFSNEKNIFQQILPIYWTVKLFGVFSMSFDGHYQMGAFRMTRFDKFYSLLMLILMIFIAYFFSYIPILRVPKIEVAAFKIM